MDNGIVAAGVLILICIGFISLIVFMMFSLKFHFKVRQFLQFLPLVILTSACLVALYQPNETERLILYIILLGYFIFLLVMWFLKRAWKKMWRRREYDSFGGG